MSLNEILSRLQTSGASAGTAKQDRLPAGGVSASHQMAKNDLERVKKYKEHFIAVGKKYGLPPALLAAIASRETRGGNLLKNGWGDRGNGFGLMQIDRRYHTPSGGPLSREHIDQATDILSESVQGVRAKFPRWSPEQQLRGGVAAYNCGVSRVIGPEVMDNKTTGHDYSSDTWARAQFLVPYFDEGAAVGNNASPKKEDKTPSRSHEQPAAPATVAAVKLGETLLSVGHQGPAVKELQAMLELPGSEQDGYFGPKTRVAVCDFQRSVGLPSDGVVGPKTWKALSSRSSSASSGPTLQMGSRGELVKLLQRRLESLGLEVGPIDGIIGQKTIEVIKAFQRSNGLTVDGIVGAKTWKKLGVDPTSISLVTSSIPNRPAVVNPVGGSLQQVKTKDPGTIQVPAQQVAGEPKWLAIARREAESGVKEFKNGENSRIIEYHATTSFKAKKDEVHWCSSFVNWCVTQAGVKGTNNAGAASWLNWGVSSNARRGAIAVIYKAPKKTAKNGMTSSGNHVGFLLEESATEYKLLGGNQSDQVKVSSFEKSKWKLKGYRMPSGVDSKSTDNAQQPIVKEIPKKVGSGGGTHVVANGGQKDAAQVAKKDAAQVAKKNVSILFDESARRDAVSDYTLGILQDIGRKAGLTTLHITSTARTPGDQARVMYDNLVGTGKKQGVAAQRKLYGKGGDQVIDTFVSAKAAGKSREQIIQAMKDKILAVGPTKVSLHTADPKVINVVDISPTRMPVSFHKAFENAVLANPLVSRLLTPSDSDPAFHLEIPQNRQAKS